MTSRAIVRAGGLAVVLTSLLCLTGQPASAICQNYPTCGVNRPPPAAVTGVTPSSGTTSGGNQVRISLRGVGFGFPRKVYFGSVPSPVVSHAGVIYSNGFITTPYVTAIAPPNPSGVVDVRVSTIDGLTPISSADRYQYCVGSCTPPGIAFISPPSGAADGRNLVTIYGHDLANIASIHFGNAPV